MSRESRVRFIRLKTCSLLLIAISQALLLHGTATLLNGFVAGMVLLAMAMVLEVDCSENHELQAKLNYD